MTEDNRTYIAIDLKSFFASVECVERGLDPLTTNLVVADVSRTEKTICLAVSPSLKAYGIGGRARLFEVVQRLREVNRRRSERRAELAQAIPSEEEEGKANRRTKQEQRQACLTMPCKKEEGEANNERRYKNPFRRLTGKSWKDEELKVHEDWEVDYIAAPPRMAKYIEYSTRIYQIYLKYVAPEDIHVYSIDEVFMDVTAYLDTYRMTAHELAMTMIRDVLKNTGITATAGIGTNLYLCKIAMDIMAKKAPADNDGVRIAELNEMSYREQLWDYTPITKFWRVGKGIAEKLAQYGMYTMGDVALCSVERERTALADSIHAMNARLMVSIWPNPQYCPEEKDFRKRGFMLEHSVYDVFNADACRHYWKYANDEFFSNGFDAWRCDSSEPLDGDWNKIPESLGEKPYGWNDHERRWHLNKDVLSDALGAERSSLYSLYHSMGLYENQRLTDSDKRVLNLTRSSYARQQRYATVVWNGDTHASCESYRQQIPAGLNYMATGNPYWTVDVGSFFVKNDYSLSLLAWDDSKQKLKLKIVKKSRIYNREIKVNVVKYILANHSWE